jgi:hypothetical protein
MHPVRPTGRRRHPALATVLLVALGLAGCSGSDAAPATSTTASPGPAVTSTAPAAGSTTTGAGGSTSAPAEDPLAAETDAPRSAPADGNGTALLKAVRVGRNAGFERIVFEFAGPARPGYRVRWVDGPITSDGAGAPVDVAGKAYLQVIMEPASGVDMDTGKLAYTGPDRIAVAGQTKLLTDLVRTGDFEAVLTWVAGAGRKVPFRVLTLSAPSRLVVDVRTAG